MKFLSILLLGIVLLGACAKETVTTAPAAISPTPSPTPEPLPEISAQLVRKLLVGKQIKDIPAEKGGSVVLDGWVCEEPEWKEIDFVESTSEGKKKTVVIQIRTGHAPGVFDADEKAQAVLSGRLRLTFEYVSKEWVLLNIENLSVKYTYAKLKSSVSNPF